MRLSRLLGYSLLVLLAMVLLSVHASANVSVQPAPYIPGQYFDANGRPLAGGCIQTFQSGTTTPLATYSDYLGSVLNTNPVQLDSAGRGRIFLTAAAYTLKLYVHGITNNCATSLGPLQWTIDGINPSANSILGTNNVWTGTNDFQGATTFDNSVTFNAGLTSSGPNVLNGGGTLAGTYSGSPIFSGTPNFTAGFLATTGSFSGQITSTVTTGTAPFVIASTTVVPNLNVALLGGCTWAVPCPIGSTTPNTGAFTTLTAATSFALAGGTVQVGTRGTDTHLLTAGTVTGTGNQLCTDAQGGATTTGCPSGFTLIQAVKKVSSTCTPGSANSFDACTDTLTWPGAFADTGYMVTCTGVQPNGAGLGSGSNLAPMLMISSYTTTQVVVITQQQRSITSTFSEIHCIGVHP